MTGGQNGEKQWQKSIKTDFYNLQFTVHSLQTYTKMN